MTNKILGIVVGSAMLLVAFQNCAQDVSSSAAPQTTAVASTQQNQDNGSQSAPPYHPGLPSATPVPTPAPVLGLAAGTLLGGCYTDPADPSCIVNADRVNTACASGMSHVYQVDVYCSPYVSSNVDCGKFTHNFWAMVCK